MRDPAKFQSENDLGKGLRHSLRKGPKCNLSRNSESYSLKVLRADSAEAIKSDFLSHLENGSGNDLSMFSKENLDLKRLENTLKVYLDKKLGQIYQSGIPIDVYCSWLSVNYTLPTPGKSYSYLDTGNTLNESGTVSEYFLEAFLP